MRRLSTIGFACALGMSVAGCSNSALFEKDSYREAFSRTPDIFSVPDWAKSSRADNVRLGPTGPVGPDDLVGADGSCAPKAEPAPQTPPPVQQQAAAPMPDRLDPATPGTFTPTISGGIALAMSECEVVRRAGQPSNIVIGTDGGERKVTLTYLTGTWPGVYQFMSGRLKVIEAAPAPQGPAPRKKTPPKRRQQASGGHIYVQ